MLRDALLLAYCGLVGCASAGAAASFHRLVTARPARFAVMGRSWMAAFSSYLFFAVDRPGHRRGSRVARPDGWWLFVGGGNRRNCGGAGVERVLRIGCPGCGPVGRTEYFGNYKDYLKSSS